MSTKWWWGAKPMVDPDFDDDDGAIDVLRSELAHTGSIAVHPDGACHRRNVELRQGCCRWETPHQLPGRLEQRRLLDPSPAPSPVEPSPTWTPQHYGPKTGRLLRLTCDIDDCDHCVEMMRVRAGPI